MLTKSTIVTQPARFAVIPLQGRSVNGQPIDYPDLGDIRLYSWIPETVSFVEKCTAQPRVKVGRRKKRNWNAFQHYKSAALPPAMSFPVRIISDKWSIAPNYHYGYSLDRELGYMGFAIDGTLEWFGPTGRPLLGLDSWEATQPDGGFLPYPDWYESQIHAALNKLLPEMKQHLSLINSVIELKDFKGLASAVHKAVTNRQTQAIWKSLRESIADATLPKTRSLKELLRAASGNYLQWMFAFRPLVSDICGIHAALRSYEKSLNEFITKMGVPQLRHRTVRWQREPDVYSESDAEHSPIQYSDGPGNFFTTTRTVRTDPIVMHVEIEFNYNFTQYQLEHAQVLGLLDAFGVNLNPAIVWNALPWSFVVDWVFGVSRWLNQHRKDNMQPQINITQMLSSYKRHRQIHLIRAETRVARPSAMPLETVAPMAVIDETAYRRDVGLPPASSIQSSGLSLTEFSLGAALVFARSRRPTKYQTIRSIKDRLARQVKAMNLPELDARLFSALDPIGRGH